MEAEAFVHRLIALGYTVAAAESCTGGLVASGIVSVPDASRVLSASFVTYSEAAKARFVGVSPETIAREGVVSEAVAAQMALGAAEAAGADVGIGTTGVAGPGGGTPACPVGTVCMAASLGAQVRTMTRRYEHCTRDQVRARAASDALLLAASLLPEQK